MVKAIAIGIVVCACGAAFTGPVLAQVRDATYLGTFVCGKLPFAQDPVRAAIEVKISGNAGSYSRPVHMPLRDKIAGTETGTAAVEGDKITLKGSWKGDKDSYDASYSGTFIRRSAQLTGTQTWTHEGKSYSRNCSGAIKRPLAIFLKKPKP